MDDYIRRLIVLKLFRRFVWREPLTALILPRFSTRCMEAYVFLGWGKRNQKIICNEKSNHTLCRPVGGR